MSDNPHMAELIEASSLGSPAAKRLRESVPAEVGEEIVQRAAERRGVWLVHYRHGEGGDEVIPYPTEVEALRHVNGDGAYEARFVPFGVSLHDLIWKIGKAGEAQ